MLIKQTVPQSGWDKFKSVMLDELFNGEFEPFNFISTIDKNSQALAPKVSAKRIQDVEIKRIQFGCEMVGRV